jgi:hypothetical protein
VLVHTGPPIGTEMNPLNSSVEGAYGRTTQASHYAFILYIFSPERTRESTINDNEWRKAPSTISPRCKTSDSHEGWGGYCLSSIFKRHSRTCRGDGNVTLWHVQENLGDERVSMSETSVIIIYGQSDKILEMWLGPISIYYPALSYTENISHRLLSQ